MNHPKAQLTVEQDLDDLKRSLEKHVAEAAHASPELAQMLTTAIHGIGDHVVSLHKRLEKLEANEDHWTTHGWEPPPGTDRSP